MNPARRSLLAAASAAAGLSLAALGGESALAIALADTARSGEATSAGELLDREPLADLGAVAAQLIPTTDTPGAADVDAHGVVDRLLARCHPPLRQQQVIRLLQQLRGAADEAYGEASFHRLTAPQQAALMQRMEQGASPFGSTHRDAWQFLKSLLVFAYCTSEAGATQLLAYDPLPGAYRGSVPYASVGKAWFE
ncbi:MAG: gluconate 2-dehydrogenase subunit 3 family protein [Pseudomonadota bacterium]